MKVMLVEDESGIRKLLRKIIEQNPGFEVVGETDNLAEAVALFSKTKPEVVFLDIEINGASGLDCAKIIADLEPKTKIIFATAHSEYMSDAFEVYAFDYLMKPFHIERVNQTLERIKSLSVAAEPMKNDELDKIVKYERGLDKLLVKGKESMSFIDIKDIILIQRENSSTVIYTRLDSFTTSASLSDIETKLDPEQFMRSHKSYLINVSQIKKIEPYGRWTYIVTFKDLNKDALMTVDKFEEIKKRFL
jgi:two-component system LytT family response regulator